MKTHEKLEIIKKWVKIKIQYFKIYWMQLKNCLERNFTPLRSYIEYKDLKSVIYKFLPKDN